MLVNQAVKHNGHDPAPVSREKTRRVRRARRARPLLCYKAVILTSNEANPMSTICSRSIIINTAGQQPYHKAVHFLPPAQRGKYKVNYSALYHAQSDTAMLHASGTVGTIGGKEWGPLITFLLTSTSLSVTDNWPRLVCGVL